MPVERQWERLHSPLGARDRRALLALAALVAIGIGYGAYRYATRPSPPSNANCVVVTVASTTGGATLRNCGPAARRFCREHPRLPGVPEQCARLGYPVGRARGNA